MGNDKVAEPAQESKPISTETSGSEDSDDSSKGTLVAMVLMFVMFLVAAGLAVYLYMDDDCSDVEGNQCLGMVNTTECKNYVDCVVDETPKEDCDDAPSDDSGNTECTVEAVYDDVYKYKKMYEENGKYYFDAEYCNEWGPEKPYPDNIGGSDCLESEMKKLELNQDAKYTITLCGDDGVPMTVDRSVEQIVALSEEELDAVDCLGEGAAGLSVLTVNDALIVAIDNGH